MSNILKIIDLTGLKLSGVAALNILDVTPIKPPVTGLVGNGRRSPARVYRMGSI